MAINSIRNAAQLAGKIKTPPSNPSEAPDPVKILYGVKNPPPFTEGNIFPLEWEVKTPKLMQIYDSARDPGWAPNRLPWDTLDPEAFTLDQRYALAYWWSLLSVFDSSGPAVFARAMIHTYETHEEDPVRKCFFSVTRDEVNHEEICQRAIQKLTPGGPLGYEPQTPLGKLARNNVLWYYHNGGRYWEGFKRGVGKYPLAILFTSFLMGEVAAATLFHGMYQRTTIPAFKEAFRCVGKDEARHMGICLAVLDRLLPQLTDEMRAQITKQLRAGYIFLSGILYQPPEQFWELPDTWRPAHGILEDVAREAGLGVLSDEERRENWRAAVLKMKGLLEPHGVAFPAIPEIGIDGETVAFDPDDIIPVF
ncbi:MAG: diiron oxygenase [Rhodospirillales bacterium]|nr:diiron oxygenase [Rhodospirillales bacterium]